ncbi:hypothetical protein [Ilumatobacter sp.]|uniref:hypothetical protein n=1 Tax=Ilumatobacter sp. TaxID=1967498 RepID=UPI003C62F0BD
MENTQPTEPIDAIDPTEATEAMEPSDATEAMLPALPMEEMLPALPRDEMLPALPFEETDHRLRVESALCIEPSVRVSRLRFAGGFFVAMRCPSRRWCAI